MQKADFLLDALPDWCERHKTQLNGVKVANTKDRGIGWVAEQDLKNDGDSPPLLVVPGDVIISRDHVGHYAVNNGKIHQLLATIGYESDRQLVLLHMLIQLILSSPSYTGPKLTADPWTEYISIQPTDVPVPTLWTPTELPLLTATSLESAVSAKLTLLSHEFESISSKALTHDFGRELFESSGVSLKDWIWVDALFRSRSFELPVSGVSCVPCLDLANHSRESNAFFVQDRESETVSLMLRKGYELKAGDEVTISYGSDKPAAEMLFNYGFIEEGTVQSLVLPLDEVLEEHASDPLLGDKLKVFGKAPMLVIKVDKSGKARWTADFLPLLCSREEDGLAFEVLGGEETPKMLWRGKDVTRMAGMWDVFVNAQDVRQVVRFRALEIVRGLLEKQIEKLGSQVLTAEDERVKAGEIRQVVLDAAIQLRGIEKDLLERTLTSVQEERERLLKDEKVRAIAQAQ